MTKSDAGLVVLTVAVGLGAGTMAMVAFGPALVAEGLISVKTLAWMVAGGAASALAMLPAWVALAD